MFKYVRGSSESLPRKGPVDVLAEPRAGHDMAAVRAKLADIGVVDVMEVTGRLISARIDVVNIPTLETVAHVTIKARHQPK